MTDQNTSYTIPAEILANALKEHVENQKLTKKAYPCPICQQWTRNPPMNSTCKPCSDSGGYSMELEVNVARCMRFYTGAPEDLLTVLQANGATEADLWDILNSEDPTQDAGTRFAELWDTSPLARIESPTKALGYVATTDNTKSGGVTYTRTVVDMGEPEVSLRFRPRTLAERRAEAEAAAIAFAADQERVRNLARETQIRNLEAQLAAAKS